MTKNALSKFVVVLLAGVLLAGCASSPQDYAERVPLRKSLYAGAPTQADWESHIVATEHCLAVARELTPQGEFFGRAGLVGLGGLIGGIGSALIYGNGMPVLETAGYIGSAVLGQSTAAYYIYGEDKVVAHLNGCVYDIEVSGIVQYAGAHVRDGSATEQHRKLLERFGDTGFSNVPRRSPNSSASTPSAVLAR